MRCVAGATRARARGGLAPVLALALMVALSAAGCGRRGSPEEPAAGRSVPHAPLDPAEPLGPQVPDRDFVLDPLLQ